MRVVVVLQDGNLGRSDPATEHARHEVGMVVAQQVMIPPLSSQMATARKGERAVEDRLDRMPSTVGKTVD